MALPVAYHMKHLMARKFSALVTLVFIMMVVAVLVVMLAVSSGLDRALELSGDPLIVVVKTKNARAESTSRVLPEMTTNLLSVGRLARDTQGQVAISEQAVGVTRARRRGDASGKQANLAVRGVLWESALAVQSRLRLLEGRPFRPGTFELVVGKSAQESYDGLEIGSKVKLGTRGDEYTVVGVFGLVNDRGEPEGGALESEAWGHLSNVMDSYNRTVFNSIRMRLADGSTPQETKDVVERIRGEGIDLDALTEPEYYAQLSDQSTGWRFLVSVLAVLMGLGAIFATTNTLYAAVAGRTREIGMLRAIGFNRADIVKSFVIEGVVTSFVGGVLGCALAMAFQGLRNEIVSDGFTAVSFQLTVTPQLIVVCVSWSVAVGLLGSLLPAWRASRIDILSALRSTE